MYKQLTSFYRNVLRPEKTAGLGILKQIPCWPLRSEATINQSKDYCSLWTAKKSDAQNDSRRLLLRSILRKIWPRGAIHCMWLWRWSSSDLQPGDRPTLIQPLWFPGAGRCRWPDANHCIEMAPLVYPAENYECACDCLGWRVFEALACHFW